MSSYHHPHHFESADHEFDSSKQGMWLFLLQEVLFFSGLFVAFAIFRNMYYDDFHAASKFLDWKMGALNTVILITSSVTMVLGVLAAAKGQVKPTVYYLIATFFLAGGFCIVKYFEYTHKFHDGVLPGGAFLNPSLFLPTLAISLVMISTLVMGFLGTRAPGGMKPNKKVFYVFLVFALGAAFLMYQYMGLVSAGDPAPITSGKAADLLAKHPHAPLFFSLYFLMTGVHAIHVVGGMIVIVWLITRAEAKEFVGGHFFPVEMVGLYWHFVDLVWIYLFPLLYLVG